MNDANAIYGFVQKKIEILDKDDPYSRAMCAKLRRAIGKHPGDSPDVWEIMLRGMRDEWLSRSGEPSYAEWSIHTAITLYALHRQGKDRTMNAQGVSFGMAAARLWQEDEARMEAVRRRFNTVATSLEFTELAYHTRGIVQLLKANDVSMDYPQFAKDLFFWKIPGGAARVRLRWGEDFYKNNTKDGSDEP